MFSHLARGTKTNIFIGTLCCLIQFPFFLLQQTWTFESRLERNWFENTVPRITENVGQLSGPISSLKQVNRNPLNLLPSCNASCIDSPTVSKTLSINTNETAHLKVIDRNILAWVQQEIEMMWCQKPEKARACTALGNAGALLANVPFGILPPTFSQQGQTPSSEFQSNTACENKPWFSEYTHSWSYQTTPELA